MAAREAQNHKRQAGTRRVAEFATATRRSKPRAIEM